jgi:hypothetical protein
MGKAGPVTENPLPVVCKADSFTRQRRALVTTTECVELAPTVTLPNETIEGEAVTASLITPPPPSSRRRSGFEALLANKALPPVHPVATGENVTLRAVFCPAERVRGRLNGDRVNSAPVRLSAEIVTLVFPLLVKTTIWVSDRPTGTPPKRRRDGEHVNCCTVADIRGGSNVTNMMMVMMVKKTWVDKARVLDWGSLIQLV